jgi:hypothetical protein
MKTNHKLVSLLAVIISLSVFVMPSSAFNQPYMVAAKKDLNNAKNALKRATADKGGHRERAVDLVNRAIDQVEKGIAYDKQNPNNRPRRNFSFDENERMFSVSMTDQPNMQIAKEHLEKALANLERATADKGGYRVNALQLVREAIAEVQRGIEYDRRN